ncbi:hypothetical protein ACFV3R_15535 [Streptomyces sp. NPDC059740]|uniref:hypothetical protein n=1 Tax=Streptomyces sp. NPDC059740 TaxID=3346926 RepID=UPI003655757C
MNTPRKTDDVLGGGEALGAGGAHHGGAGRDADEGLRVRVAVRRNPYPHLLGDGDFSDLLSELGARRAASIRENHRAAAGQAPRGPYPRPAMGFVVLDPTADAWVPHAEAVMAAVTVGEDARQYLPRAAAKAATHRRLGRNNGEAVHTDPHLLTAGDFRYGHSAEVRGLIVAASSQTPDQDLYEASRLASDLVEEIGLRYRRFEWRHGETDWFSAADEPGRTFGGMVDWFPA